VHIKRLRTLIEDDSKNPEHITTVRGVGYRYEATKASA
jgi:DNA-binding response OmpR family regulator